MYAIICYAIHEQDVASVDVRDTYEEACEFLEADARNTFNEEVASGGNDVKLSVDSEIARVNSCDDEYIWTWHIVPLNK